MGGRKRFSCCWQIDGNLSLRCQTSKGDRAHARITPQQHQVDHEGHWLVGVTAKVQLLSGSLSEPHGELQPCKMSLYQTAATAPFQVQPFSLLWDPCCCRVTRQPFGMGNSLGSTMLLSTHVLLIWPGSVPNSTWGFLMNTCTAALHDSTV